MPPSSDDPPSTPSVERVERESPSAAEPSAPGDGVPADDPASAPPVEGGGPRRHRRRRHRRRPPPAADTGEPGASDQRPVGEPAFGGAAPPTDNPPTDNPPTDNPPGAPAGEGGSPETAPASRRRRRRRRPPRGVRPGQTPAAAGQGQPAESAPPSEPAEGEGAELAPPHQRAPGEPPHRRRRRRRPHRPEFAPEAGETQEEANASGTAIPRSSDGQRPQARDGERVGQPRRRYRQRRPRPEAGAAGASSGGEGASTARSGGAPGSGLATARGSPIRTPRRRPAEGPGEQRRRNTAPGATSERDVDRRDRRSPDRGLRGKGPRDPRRGRGRDEAPRAPERKLYALESVVDRGFEDVPDEADEGAARRVHWTIIKRTVADQKSGKPMSAVYVMQRDGVEAEFPNLGAARAAVNKTIIHPEKLTLSKAEHAAAKK